MGCVQAINMNSQAWLNSNDCFESYLIVLDVHTVNMQTERFIFWSRNFIRYCILIVQVFKYGLTIVRF
jgi:hypothetical protein